MAEEKQPEYPWNEYVNYWKSLPEDFRNITEEIFDTTGHFFMNPVFNVYITDDEHFDTGFDFNEQLLSRTVTDRITDIEIIEDMDGDSTFTITMLDFRQQPEANHYNITDSYLFRPGAFVTIELGYLFGIPGAPSTRREFVHAGSSLGRKGLFVRPICYKWVIESVTPDFPNDGAPTVKVSGTNSLDVAFNSWRVPHMSVSNVKAFLESVAATKSIPINYDHWEDGRIEGSENTILTDPSDTAGSIKSLIVTGTETYKELFEKIEKYMNHRIFVDTRTNILWDIPHAVGVFPHLYIQRGDSFVEFESGETFIQLIPTKIFCYNTGLNSDVISASVVEADFIKPRRAEVAEVGVQGPTADEANYYNRRGYPDDPEEFEGTAGVEGTITGPVKPAINNMVDVVDKSTPHGAGRFEGELPLSEYTDNVEEELFAGAPEALKKLVQSYTDHSQWNVVMDIDVIGDPLTRPGHIGWFMGFGERLSGEYEIRRVVHRFNADGGYKQNLIIQTNTTKERDKEDKEEDWYHEGMNAL